MSTSRALNGVSETLTWAGSIAEATRDGAWCIGLSGDLGAGKTQVARGIVAALEPELSDWVSSPTYNLVQTYPLARPVHHLDLYRLESADDLESIGFWELLDEDALILIEWPERIPEAAVTCDITITLRYGETDDSRIASLAAGTPRGAEALLELGAEGLTTSAG